MDTATVVAAPTSVEEANQRIGSMLFRLRERAGFSQAQVDTYSGGTIGQAWLSRVENGLLAVTIDTAVALALIYNVEPSALLGEIADTYALLPIPVLLQDRLARKAA